ncbi:MAG TPA: ArsR family transcriptional regulator [candidate division WOR-3 bacterium]|uniref:ArsR family transcriptional regulator n=1 Tax=candidate division WOR-3 bacterium TaxID=2052148 RepID=A0A7C0Z8Z5_UNCW3|nr:ArsR family transcriptional regulator [candidate division WOR-3 bacterium]
MAEGFEELDSVIHERVRLGILTFLARNGETDFGTLKKALDVTDGNLSRHLRVLEEEGIINVKKTFVKRRPRTYYKLTNMGKKRFNRYLQVLEDILKSVTKKEE